MSIVTMAFSVSSGTAVAHTTHVLPIVHILRLMLGSVVNLLRNIFEHHFQTPFPFMSFIILTLIL